MLRAQVSMICLIKHERHCLTTVELPYGYLLCLIYEKANVIQLALHEDSTNGDLEYVFIVCLQIRLCTGYTLIYIHMLTWGHDLRAMYIIGYIDDWWIYTLFAILKMNASGYVY